MPVDVASAVPVKRPGQEPGSTVPVKILGACAVLLMGTMVYNSIGGWHAQSHGQRSVQPAALPLQRRMRKSRFARQDDVDSPSEVMVEELVSRDGKGMGKGRGGRGKGKGRGAGGLAAIFANQPASLRIQTAKGLVFAVPPPPPSPPPGTAPATSATSSNATGLTAAERAVVAAVAAVAAKPPALRTVDVPPPGAGAPKNATAT